MPENPPLAKRASNSLACATDSSLRDPSGRHPGGRRGMFSRSHFLAISRYSSNCSESSAIRRYLGERQVIELHGVILHYLALHFGAPRCENPQTVLHRRRIQACGVGEVRLEE